MNSLAQVPQPPALSDKDNVRHWCIKVHAYLNATGIQDENVKKSIVLQLFNETAMDWYQNPIECNVITAETTSTDILDGLNKFLTPISSVSLAEQEIATLVQSGTVQEYLCKFMKLCTRIPDMTNPERRRCFVRGLKPAIQREIYKQSGLTFEQVQQIALVFDGTRRMFPEVARHHQKSENPVFAHRAIRNLPEPMDVTRMDVKNFPKITEAERNYLREKGGCFACRQIGHSAKRCPTFKQTRRINEADVSCSTMRADEIRSSFGDDQL